MSGELRRQKCDQTYFMNKKNFAGLWWQMPLLPTLEREGQVGLCGFKVSLICTASSTIDSKAIQRNPSQNKGKIN